MTRLLEASVVYTLLFDDNDAGEIAAFLISTSPIPAISSFAWGETVGAMVVKVRSGMIRADTATRVLAAFANDITRWPMLKTTGGDISAATTFIEELTRPLRFTDAVHIATARRLGVTLLSTDRQQLVAAPALGVSPINPLEQPS